MVSPRSRTRLSLDARRQNGRFLARAAAEQYQLSPRQAGLLVSMSAGASIVAAELARHHFTIAWAADGSD